MKKRKGVSKSRGPRGKYRTKTDVADAAIALVAYHDACSGVAVRDCTLVSPFFSYPDAFDHKRITKAMVKLLKAVKAYTHAR